MGHFQTGDLFTHIAEHAGDGTVRVMDVANIGDHDPDDSGLGEPAKARLALAQGILGLPPRLTLPAFAQLALDRRSQEATEFVLENIVVRSRAHRIDRVVFTNGSGHDDEERVEPLLFQDGECGWALIQHRPVER